VRGWDVELDTRSDEALLAAALGDDEAWVAFVRRYQRRVYGLALSILGDPHDAEDVAQEALVRVWRHAPVFDPQRGRVATWILTITRNLAIDTLRLRRALPMDPAALSELEMRTPEPGPAERAITHDAAERLRRAVQSLPEDQRRALVLAAFHGRTAGEIATLESIPLGTAKTRIRAAMQRLRGTVESEERAGPRYQEMVRR
jgi:RNA polymerase sigma factor (sigma-70 family)